jgi:glutaredoxin
MKLQSIIGVLACLLALSAQAQYKYIGPDGKVVYSDQPPPANAKVLEKKAMPSGAGANASDLPAPLAQAVKTSPVTLYTAPNCPSCTNARAMLNQRGIPFAEKTVSTPEDAAAFNKVNSAGQVPVLTVGATKLAPFSPDDWNNALTTAGYPANSQLPPGYKAPPVTNLAQNSPPAQATGATAAPAAPPAAAADTKPSWFKGF